MKTPPVAGALMAALAILWMTPTVQAQIVALGPPAPAPNNEPRAATATPPAPNSDSPATTGTPPAPNNEPPAATGTPPPPSDAPPPAAPPAAPDPIERARKALYERKPLIKTDVFTLELEGQLQIKYLHDQGTAETNGTYYTRPISQGFDNSLPHASLEGTDSFTIRRARIALLGNFLYPWIKFQLQTDLVGQTEPDTKKKIAETRNAYIEFTKNPAIQVRVGQFKIPFSYEQMTSSKYLQFTERGLVDDILAGESELNDKGDFNKVAGTITPVALQGYDLGLMVYGTDPDKRYGYEVGAFNGNGRNTNGDNDGNFQYAFRVHYDSKGGYALDETAVKNPAKLEYTIGLAYTQDTFLDKDITGVELFAGGRYKRLAAHAAWYRIDNGRNELKSTLRSIQTGYFVVPRRVEIAARYAWVNRDDNTRNLDHDPLRETETLEAKEYRIGANYYFEEHHLKLMLDAGKVSTKLDVLNLQAGDSDAFNHLDGRREIESKQIRGMLALYF